MRSVHLGGNICALRHRSRYATLTRKNDTMVPDLLADPFRERSPTIAREHFQLLGGRFQFESDSSQLLRLVDSAYSGLPPHRLSAVAPRLRVRLLLCSRNSHAPAEDRSHRHYRCFLVRVLGRCDKFVKLRPFVSI